MKSLIAIVGCVLVIAWVIEYLSQRRYRARNQQRDRSQWWKEPPQNDDLGDH